ncbi:MAG: ATP-binding cassette domain-containing protein [Candidatus Eisenbacteria bacterium]
MIRFEHVDYSIGGRKILEDVSFQVVKGTTKIILGPSGIGKSTVLRLILGLVKPERGDILVDGESVVSASGDQLNGIRQRIGMVFQDGALFDSLTVGENIGFWLLENSDASLDEVDRIAREKLVLVGLDPELIDSMPDELSLGMQRRVAIARALASGQPKVILYDEPTTGLDPNSLEMVTDVILRLRADLSMTSIVVTHQIPDALKVGTDYLFLFDRTVHFEGHARELATSVDPDLAHFLDPFKKSLITAVANFSATSAGSGAASAAERTHPQ